MRIAEAITKIRTYVIDMCRSHILSQNRELPSSTIPIPTALSHTLADNRRVLTLQLFHQPHHLISVQTRDLPDLRVRQTDLAVLGALPLVVLWASEQLSPLLPGFPLVLWQTTLALVLAQVPVIDPMAVLTESGDLVVTLVHRSGDCGPIELTIDLEGFRAHQRAEQVTLAGETWFDRNTREAPEKIVPRRTQLTLGAETRLVLTLAPFSISQVTFHEAGSDSASPA